MPEIQNGPPTSPSLSLPPHPYTHMHATQAEAADLYNFASARLAMNIHFREQQGRCYWGETCKRGV